MANITRRQLLVDGSNFIGTNFIPGIAATPFLPTFNPVGRAMGADLIQKPSYEICTDTNENP